MPTKYLYLIWSLYFAFIALLMYYKMLKYRKPMLILWLAIFWAGPVSEYFWMTKDWWHPETITWTIIGIEDFIFSFSHIIIPMFIYKLVFKKDTDKDFKKENIIVKNAIKNFILWFLIPFTVSWILFWIFQINSVLSVLIGMLLSCFTIVFLRKDLFIPSILWAIIIVIIALPAYLLLEYLNPEYIEKLWFMSKLTWILWLWIPIEDIIWYAIYWFMMSGAYEFIFDFKLVDRKTI